MVLASTRAGFSWSMPAASPDSASRNGTTDRATCSARRAAVAEPVGVAEPQEGVEQQPAQADPAGQVPGVLGVELVAVHLGRDRDDARGGHRLIPGTRRAARSAARATRRPAAPAA